MTYPLLAKAFLQHWMEQHIPALPPFYNIWEKSKEMACLCLEQAHLAGIGNEDLNLAADGDVVAYVRMALADHIYSGAWQENILSAEFTNATRSRLLRSHLPRQ